MEKVNDQRTEKRLRYRWPVHFTKDDQEKTYPGQIVDISSEAMAFLCRFDENCPQPGQILKITFGTPHFDFNDSFDTVLFNRTGHVSRLDKLSSQVYRVIIRFNEPLFFKPGEQDITESDVQLILETKALSILKAEESVKVYDEALTRAEEKIKFYTEAKTKAEDRLKSEAKARARAEARAGSEAKLRAKAEKNVGLEAAKRAKTEAELQKKTEFYNKEIAKIKAEKDRAISKIKADTVEAIDKIEKELNAKGISSSGVTGKHPIKEVVLKKVDRFVTDRNKIF
jgi:hypothetical protein